MRVILVVILAMPIVASAQSDDALNQWLVDEALKRTQPQPQQVYGLPVQPVLPVPQDNGPWGTGYSVVTTTRPKTNLFDRDMVGSETVQRVVPNDGLGQPMRGLDLQGW